MSCADPETTNMVKIQSVRNEDEDLPIKSASISNKETVNDAITESQQDSVKSPKRSGILDDAQSSGKSSADETSNRSDSMLPSGILPPKPKLLERQIKKTCEACVKSKVKCDGNRPCDRCVKRGVDCVFVMEQKRGRRPGPLHEREVTTSKTLRLDDSESTTEAKKPTEALSAQYVDRKVPPLPPRRDPLVSTTSPNVGSMRGFVGMMPPQPSHNFGSPSPLYPSNVYQGFGLAYPAMMGGAPMTIPSGMFWTSGVPHTFPGMMPAYNAAPMSLPVMTSIPSTYERRLLRAFFALYKHHHSGAPADQERQTWFNARFSKLWACLRKRGVSMEELSLNKWMSEHRIQADPNVDSFPINPLFVKHGPNFARLGGASTRQVISGVKLGTINVFSDFQLECDDDIVRSLGYDQHSISSANSWIPCGFLPWGAEVIARVAKNDQDVYNYIREVARSFARSQPDSSGVMRARSEYPMTVLNANGVEVNAIVFSDVIESMAQNGLLLQGVSIHFFLDAGSANGESDAALGPWPNSSTFPKSNWLEPTLHWVDNQKSTD